jgi:Holliday junction resolvase
MNQYRRGYRAELALVKLLKQRDEFHTVIKSAGSRSPFDVVAIGASRVLLCQVKTGKVSLQGEVNKLKLLPAPRGVSKQVWIYRKGKWTTLPAS